MSTEPPSPFEALGFTQEEFDKTCESASAFAERILREVAHKLGAESGKIAEGPLRTLFEIRVLSAIEWTGRASCEQTVVGVHAQHGLKWATFFASAYIAQARAEPGKPGSQAPVHIALKPKAPVREDMN